MRRGLQQWVAYWRGTSKASVSEGARWAPEGCSFLCSGTCGGVRAEGGARNAHTKLGSRTEAAACRKRVEGRRGGCIHRGQERRGGPW